MGALTSDRNKRAAEFQSSWFSNNHPHISKKLKSSSQSSPSMASKKTSESMVSRLISRYPQQVTPIGREIHAPCSVINGFNARSKRPGASFSGIIRKNEDFSDEGKVHVLFSKYNHAKEAAIGSCRHVKFEEDSKIKEVIEIDNEEIDKDENAASEDSGVEEVELGKDKSDYIDKPREAQMIIAKYRDLDEKAEESHGLQPSSSSGVELELRDEKMLEGLSLNQRSDASDVLECVPLHKKLLRDSAKSDSKLRELNFDIELLEKKRALYQLLRPTKKEEDTIPEPFRPLTEDEEEMVANALSNATRRKVLVTHENSNITITGEVIQCLKPKKWLNDEVINVYLELLKEREKREPQKFLKCHFFNTFFYKKLNGKKGYDYKSVRRWTTQRKLGYSLLECDKIFVPVHKAVHWCLAVINKKEGKFQYLDSLGGVDTEIMGMLATYIVDEVKDKSGKDIDVSSWKQEYVTDLPYQENGFDCGVFMIKYADFYSRDIGLCFNQDHMPYFRLRTAKEILQLRAD